jgi:hypothetical protein
VRCGGRLKVIASIEEPELIERTLAQLADARAARCAARHALGAAGI